MDFKVVSLDVVVVNWVYFLEAVSINLSPTCPFLFHSLEESLPYTGSINVSLYAQPYSESSSKSNIGHPKTNTKENQTSDVRKRTQKKIQHERPKIVHPNVLAK